MTIANTFTSVYYYASVYSTAAISQCTGIAQLQDAAVCQVGGLCCAKADDVVHAAEQICGAQLDDKWLTTMLEVLQHKLEKAKRATTWIRAKCEVVNKECEKSILLPLLKPHLSKGEAMWATC